MIRIRPTAPRGHAHHGWLDTWHTFSFADYHHPQQMGWGPQRVINDDTVAPGAGFTPHGHRDMEIVTYVLSGALEHQDSLGTGSVIRPGDVQRMSAGRGIRHSEFNPSRDESAHLLQIWIEPRSRGIDPSYEQEVLQGCGKTRHAALGGLRRRPVRIGHPVHQYADLYAGLLTEGERVIRQLAPGRLGYLHVARGRAFINGQPLAAGDGVKIAEEERIELMGGDRGGELLLFELPASG